MNLASSGINTRYTHNPKGSVTRQCFCCTAKDVFFSKQVMHAYIVLKIQISRRVYNKESPSHPRPLVPFPKAKSLSVVNFRCLRYKIVWVYMAPLSPPPQIYTLTFYNPFPPTLHPNTQLTVYFGDYLKLPLELSHQALIRYHKGLPVEPLRPCVLQTPWAHLVPPM